MCLSAWAGTGHLVFQGKSQEGQSTFGEVWAVPFRKSITDKYLQQDMNATDCLSDHYNFYLFCHGQTLYFTAGSRSIDDPVLCKVGRWLQWPPPKWTTPSQNSSLAVWTENSNSALNNHADFDICERKITKWIM